MEENKITIIRHGTTLANQDGKERGWSNVPLDSKGIKQAYDVGKKLRNKGIDGVISSDLRRAITTGNIVAKEIGVPYLGSSKALRTWDVGELVGQKHEDVKDILKHHVMTGTSTKLPGGESFDTFKSRFLHGIEMVIKKYKGQHIAVVTHHSGERVLNAWLAKGQRKDMSVIPQIFLEKGIPPGSSQEITIKQIPDL